MDKYIRAAKARVEVETLEDWDSLIDEIPYIQFKPEWSVKIIPPYAGATARFLVTEHRARVSVYLDSMDRLGSVGEPYWEVYPIDEDVRRVLMRDVDSLIKAIDESIEQQLARPEIKRVKHDKN
jgi:hypothetical protein